MTENRKNYFPHLSAAALTDPGLVRPNNEDAFWASSEDGVFAVADGMGGGAAGEIASQMIVDALRSALAGSAGKASAAREFATEQALENANAEITDYAWKWNFRLMGSTVALLLFDPQSPTVVRACHIGDSRIYLFRKHELTQLTDDHTVAAEIERKLAAGHKNLPQNSRLSHVLTRAVGTSRVLRPEWQNVAVRPNDIFLLCSDGLSTMLSDPMIAEVLQRASSLRETAEELRNRALRAGGMDNITIALVKIAAKLPAA